MVVTESPRPEYLFNLSNNGTQYPYPYFFHISGSVVAIIVLVAFILVLVIGNLLLSLYLYKMARGLINHSKKTLKNIENSIWEVRKSCTALKKDMPIGRASPPGNTNVEEGEGNGGDEMGGNKTVLLNSRFEQRTSTPDRISKAAAANKDIEIISPITGQRGYGHTKPKKVPHSPERERPPKKTHFLSSTVIPVESGGHIQGQDQALELMNSVIDQSFERMIDKVDPYRHQNKTK